jgi:hypothetical protein
MLEAQAEASYKIWKEKVWFYDYNTIKKQGI